ncbi:MAG: hypothetical protein LBO06_03700 [Bacteroidales bacterium]|jgi:hypothetical protein|nr:hypothetical protein [Bacteroidales bacterium]
MRKVFLPIFIVASLALASCSSGYGGCECSFTITHNGVEQTTYYDMENLADPCVNVTPAMLGIIVPLEDGDSYRLTCD